MDGGAWWAAIHGVAEGWTRLSDFTFTFHFHALEKMTVQPADVAAAPGALHTRLARLSAVETDLGDYRELVLDCHFAPKRRRRAAHEGGQPYPVLRAAHAAPVGGHLAAELSIPEGQEVLFGVFSTSRDSSPGADPNSVVCAFPVHLLDTLIEQGVERCCEPPVPPGLRRGLDFFQLPSFCPDAVSRRKRLSLVSSVCSLPIHG